MIESLLNAVGRESTKAYSNFTSPWDAIDLCLNLRGDFKLTKWQIRDEIVDGGYVASTATSPFYLINDSLNYHIRKGVLIVKDELVGRHQRNGL